jgi:Flp pilus assembly protein TadB
MAVSIVVYSLAILAAISLIFIAACAFYLIQQYCLRSRRDKRRTQSDQKQHPGQSATRTQSDDDSTSSRLGRLHTFDQILKQEERSGYSVHPLKLPQLPAVAAALEGHGGVGLAAGATAGSVTGANHPKETPAGVASVLQHQNQQQESNKIKAKTPPPQPP